MIVTILLIVNIIFDVVIIVLLWKISKGPTVKLKKSDILFFAEAQAHEKGKRRFG
jgi:hypothetical protein